MDQNRVRLKTLLLDRHKRLENVVKDDLPILADLENSIGLDMVKRLQGVLADYRQTIDAWLQQIEREERESMRAANAEMNDEPPKS